ncbi:MAG: hypothetical protein ACRC4W_06445 [Treponemataceae bacterium]
MKKISMLMLVLCCSVSIFAVVQESEFTVLSYPVMRAYRNRDGIVVVFQKNSAVEQSQLYIPARWFAFQDKRSELVRTSNKVHPYVSVYKKNGEFSKVILYMPTNPVDPAWQRIPNGMDFTAQFDSESFIIE